MEEISCKNCKFLAFQDEGYSNYTVMETSVICMKKQFDPVDESSIPRVGPFEQRFNTWFSEQAGLCPFYSEMTIEETIHFDVEDFDKSETIRHLEDSETKAAAYAYFCADEN
jgi:hypothetical protein